MLVEVKAHVGILKGVLKFLTKMLICHLWVSNNVYLHFIYDLRFHGKNIFIHYF